jgi:hypothetical protein
LALGIAASIAVPHRACGAGRFGSQFADFGAAPPGPELRRVGVAALTTERRVDVRPPV